MPKRRSEQQWQALFQQYDDIPVAFEAAWVLAAACSAQSHSQSMLRGIPSLAAYTHLQCLWV